VSTYSADAASVLHYNYVITRTWRATDVAGNFSECIQSITVHDITNPTFTVPGTITICRAADCTYDINTSITGDVTDESDNCTPATLLNATYTDDNSGLIDCDNYGFILRTWTLTDIAGNTTVKIQTIWIEPTPKITIVNNTPIICNEANVNLVFGSPSISITTANLSYVVTVTSTDPAHLGGTASSGFTLLKADLPFTLTGTLTNSSDVPIVVSYTATPKLNGCSDGPVQIITVTVNPTPQVEPSTLAQTICNDGTTSVTLASPSTFTSGVITFNYTVSATGGVTGFTTPVTNLPKDFVISDVLHNPTDSPQTVTYTIVPISPTGCTDGPSKTVIITVNPTPQVVPSILAQTLCNDGTTNIILGSPSTFSNGPVTFNYTVVATGGVTGFTTPVTGLPKDHVISDVLHNPTDAPQTVTYIIVPVSPAGCAAGPSKTVIITVDPTPQVVPGSLTQTICNDGTTNITLASPSTFSSGVITFNYTVVATGGVTGFTTPVTGLPKDFVISDVLHNPTDAPQTVTYTVVPISPAGCAAGPSKIVTVTINPTPQVVPSALTQRICNTGTTSIVLTSPSIFSNGVITFNYTVVATGGVTGFTSPVTGLPDNFVLSDVLNNPTNDPQTVTYTIVPISPTGCPDGPVKIVVITVEPTPQVNPSTLAQTICNDGTTNIVLSSPSTFTTGVITFNYTVVATGGVTGFTTPVTGLANNSIISDLLHNPTDAPQTVIYTVVPISPECSATDPIKIITVTVNPTPKVIPGTLAQTICNDGTTSVTLASPSTFTSGVITFNYTVSATGGVTGFTTPVTNLPKDFVISDVLHNPTDAPQTVTYTIVPISPTGCPDGPSKTVIITVNPTPQVVPSILAQTLCNDGTTNIILGSPSTFSNGPVTFNYTVVATGGVTGFTTPVTGLPKDHVISDVLHNPTDAPQTVTYIIVPVSPAGCAAGPSKTVIITVDPTPQVVPGSLTQTICNDGTTNITLASPSTFSSGVITFNYTVVATGGVTGFTTPVTGLPKDFVISDVLHNPTDAPQTVTYTVVPISPAGCAAGPSKIVTVTINPTPQVVPGTLAETICNDATLNIVLGSPSTFSNGVITFNYTVVATGGVTGFATPVTGLPKDHIISDVLHNPTNSPQTVTYTVVPVSPTGCASGPAKIITITINPTPQVVPSTLSQTICNDATTNVILGSPSTFTSGVITFNYTVVATGGVTGFNTPVTGLPKDYDIADVLHNPTDSPQTVTYTISPVSPTGCPAGPVKTVVITINPTPQVEPSTLSQTICNDGTTSVVLSSPSTFTSGVITFKYTVSATGGVTGFTTPVTNLPKDFVISDVLHNPTDAPQTVTYTIVPVSPTGCPDGPAKIVVIIVNPTPQVVPSTLAQTLCNDGTTNIILGSPTTFSNGLITFNYTAVATGGVTGFTSPVTGLPKDYVISDILHNPTDAPQTVTYTIVPISPTGCSSGPIKTVVITIDPTPRIFPIPSNSLQCDSITTNIQLQSPSLFTSGLITFKYTVTTTGTVTGFNTPLSGIPNNQIIADRLINGTDHFQIVTYRVVPVSPTGCSDGQAQDISVTVNPTPRVVPSNISNLKPDSSICSGGTTAIQLTTPTVMTSGSIRFDYNISITGGPGTITGNTSPEVNRIPGYIIGFPYQNSSDTIQSVYYAITPKVDNGICVPGRRVISEIKVHARPLQSIVVTKPLTCSGGAGLAALRAVISKGANPYQVVWDGPVGYHKVDSLAIANLSSGKYVIEVTDNLNCSRKDSISIVPVTARAYISADVIPPGNYNISCIGSTDGTILVAVTGGITPPYNYSVIKNDTETLYSGTFTNNLNLTDPLTYHYYNNLGAGSYTLLIRDVNSCENSSRIVFRVPPPMVASYEKSIYAGNFNISCKGYNDGFATALVSGGRGGYSYRWYTFNGVIPGSFTTNRIDNVTAGTYYLEIKDVLNCVHIDSTVITEPDGMQLSGSQLSRSPDGNFNISCNGGNDGSISMTIMGGSGNFVFSWTGPAGFTATTKDLTGLKAGVYTCLVKDQNGCNLTPSPSFTLTEPSALVIGTPATSVSTDGAYNINCYGSNSGWIGITVSGGSIGTYSYAWSTSDGSGLIAGQKDQALLTAGTYHLEVTDANGCLTARDIILTQPPELITQLSAVNITCKSPGFNNGSIGLTVTGGVAPYSYLWSNGAITSDISDLVPGVYTVTVTDFNGCIKTEPARIDLPPTLNYTKNLSDYNGYNISCNGLSNGFINIEPTTGLAPFIFTWSGPDGFVATTKNISNLKAGIYQLQITDLNECKASETFDLTEPGKLGMTFTLPSSIAGGFNINCAGDSTGSIDVEPVNQVKAVDYLWADGIFGKTRTNLPAGNYSIIITDENNCHANGTITLTQPDSMKIHLDVSAPFCPDKPDGRIDAVVAGGVRGADYLYRWSDNSTNMSLANIPAGYYEVTVADMNGCIIKDSVNVKAENQTCLVLPNAISPNGDLINDVWNIGLKELYPSMEVIIFNRWGETIWRSEKGYPRPWDGTSNGENLPIDSYHYIIDLHNGSKPIVGNVTIVR
jgi:gliding motility-associated-like protein